MLYDPRMGLATTAQLCAVDTVRIMMVRIHVTCVQYLLLVLVKRVQYGLVLSSRHASDHGTRAPPARGRGPERSASAFWQPFSLRLQLYIAAFTKRKTTQDAESSSIESDCDSAFAPF